MSSFIFRGVLRFLFVLVVSCGDAIAAGSLKVSVGSLQSAIPVVMLEEIRSVPGETREAFLLRVGSVLQSYTERTAFEGCGLIWESHDGTGWAVPLTSNEAHAGCVITSAPAAGMRPTRESIHSHPAHGQETYRVSSVDRALLLGHAQLHAVRRSDGRTFSPTDLAGGPGYVVAEGRLLHHDGAGAASIRDLGAVPRP